MLVFFHFSYRRYGRELEEPHGELQSSEATSEAEARVSLQTADMERDAVTSPQQTSLTEEPKYHTLEESTY